MVVRDERSKICIPLIEFCPDYRREETHETPKQYEERIRRQREEQLAAQERRKQEAAARKEKAAKEREQGSFKL